MAFDEVFDFFTGDEGHDLLEEDFLEPRSTERREGVEVEGCANGEGQVGLRRRREPRGRSFWGMGQEKDQKRFQGKALEV